MMKTSKLCLFIVLCLGSRDATCDIIPPNSHFVNKCVVISNVTDYPDISLVGVTTSEAQDEIYLIGPATCLWKWNKVTCLAIFGVRNSYLEGKDISQINWFKDRHAFRTNIIIEPRGEYADNSNLIYSIYQYYKIVGFTDSSVEIYKYREVDYFCNGRIAVSSSGKYAGDSTKLSQSLPEVTEVASGSYRKKTNVFPSVARSDLVNGSYFANIIMGDAIETKKIVMEKSWRYDI
jgi:hypothetical protein